MIVITKNGIATQRRCFIKKKVWFSIDKEKHEKHYLVRYINARTLRTVVKGVVNKPYTKEELRNQAEGFVRFNTERKFSGKKNKTIETEFIGKRKDNGVWVRGDLLVSGNKTYIHPRANAFQVEHNLAKLIVVHEVDKISLFEL